MASQHHHLLDLPPEVLVNILSHLSTPSFFLIISTCRKLFQVASESRDIILQHLQQVPGIKLGLNDPSISTQELFLTFRQRASAHLLGANLTADCREFRFSNGTLDTRASSLTASTEYINLALVLKESVAVRLYGGRCTLKDVLPSPYADGSGKILHIVHRRHLVSVLYSWTPDEPDPSRLASLQKASFVGRPKTPVKEPVSDDDGKSSKRSSILDTEARVSDTGVKYHLLHYNVQSSDRPFFITIPPRENNKALVPVHLAVYNRLTCAIIWDKPNSLFRPSTLTEVVVYSCESLPACEEGFYNEFAVFGSDRTKLFKSRRPRAASFLKDCRRLKLYRMGDILPTTVTSAYSTEPQLSSSSHNEIILVGKTFFFDNPFFGTHEPEFVDGRVECVLTHLCLGVTRAGPGGFPPVLCILQNRKKVDYEDCRHSVDLDSMPHQSSQTRIVARLWGWNECASTITGLDAVCVSMKGTRIAVAVWDRVLVWNLDPLIFCEQWDDEVEDTNVGIGKVNLRATEFYPLVVDDEFRGELVELRPILLKLDGAVARKLMWGSHRATEDNESDEESETESDGASEWETAEEDDDVHDGTEAVVYAGSTDGATDLPGFDVRPGPDNDTGHDLNDDVNKAPWPPVEHAIVTPRIATPVPPPPIMRTTLEQRIEELAAHIEAENNRAPVSNTPQDYTATAAAESAAAAGTATSDGETDPKSDTISSSTHQPGSHSKGKYRSKSRRPKRKRQRRPRKSEDKLTILTDRGVQIWDLSVWGRGRRQVSWLEEKLS